MNFWIFRKKRYSVGLKKIINNNDFFLFWNFKNINNNLNEFTMFLETLNISTIWLKQGVFSSLYLNNKNIKLKSLLRSQCFFSYSKLNKISFNQFIASFEKYKSELILLGIIINNNLFLDVNRFELVKDYLKQFDKDINSLYTLFLRKIFIFYVLNRILWIKLLYLQLYKKNFTIIK